MMRNKLKAPFMALSVIGLMLLGAGAVLQYEASAGGYAGNVISDTYEFDAPREFIAITNSVPITIGYGDTDKVGISYMGGLPLICSEEKGTLRITQNDTFSLNLFSSRISEAYIRITLPHKKYERISLSSSSGSISAEPLVADSVEVGTKSGDITVSGIDEHTVIRSESGNINAGVSSLGGDMTITGGSGDITLLLPRELSFELEYFTENGSFTSDYFDEYYYDRYGDAALLYGGAERLLRVNTTSGDLRIFGSTEKED